MVISTISPTINDHAVADVRWCLAQSRAPRLRTMRQFLEDEVVLVEGPYAGRRWNARRQPYAGLLVDAIDSGHWRRHAITGCVQSGKSLHGYVYPALYHLFELRETVILGLPVMELAKDKWRTEILPVIQRSRYRDLLPRTGLGSRGGTPDSIEFRHGPTLKFMSGGGGDETRSSFTSRVVVITEADKMDTAGEASRESSPIAQLEARTQAFGEQARIYLECTVSIEEGAIWQEWTGGSRSRIKMPCPHCGAYVEMERDDLVVDHFAKTAGEAARTAAWFCRACGESIDDAGRRWMVARGLLLHDGQTVEKATETDVQSGRIAGEPPETDTLGFRWSAFHNLFWTTGQIAVDEWKARRARDPDDAERARRQFAWALPVEADAVDDFELDPQQIAGRIRTGTQRGTVPASLHVHPENEEPADLPVRRVSMGVDLRKRQLHWIAPCWADYATGHVVSYGTLKVYSDNLGERRAVLAALRYLRDHVVAPGFAVDGQSDNRRPDAVLIDAGWLSPVVYQFVRECEASEQWAGLFHCAAGRGRAKSYNGRYQHRQQVTRSVRVIGEQFYFVRDPEHKIRRGLVNADWWKTWWHQRLVAPTTQPGSLTLPTLADGDHTELARHWAAEQSSQVWDAAAGGWITVWEARSRVNHYLDASYFSGVAAYLAGVRADGPIVDKPTWQSGTWFRQRGRR